jgi:hypothetical protein
MKDNLLTTIKLVLADRFVAILLLTVIVGSLVYCIYVSLSLHPSDLQVAVHYSAYGDNRFYREKWYYLISFIIFGLITLFIHTVLILKFYALQRRQLAIAFSYLSILILMIAGIITHSILQVAFL